MRTHEDLAIERKLALVERYLSRSTKAVKCAVELALQGERLAPHLGLALFEEAELPLLSLAATIVRIRQNGHHAYYNRNGHIEPTNICFFNCAFCSFRQEANSRGAWLLDLDTIRRKAEEQAALGHTEIHITGGVHPQWRLDDLVRIVKTIRTSLPQMHIKAFSAIELLAIFKWSNLTIREGLQPLVEAGLNSIPGGGAEIFDTEIRSQICPDKGTASEWLSLHEEAHKLGLFSNATMLYGHIETYAHRIDHLERLRTLQDRTHGFNCFIPLKFRAQGNRLGLMGEIPLTEVLRTYAVSRLYLDNIRHLKAYWPMLGKENISLALAHGADDLDGTIDNTTRIYSMAGATDQQPSASVDELQRIIKAAGYTPTERNSLYEPI